MLKELHNLSVYGENYDDIVGVVNLKNIFAHFENENFNLADIMTEAPYDGANWLMLL
jgi:putative hemolysin